MKTRFYSQTILVLTIFSVLVLPFITGCDEKNQSEKIKVTQETYIRAEVDGRMATFQKFISPSFPSTSFTIS